jgi:hypothetical protein
MQKHIGKDPSIKPKMSGAQLVGMVATLEAFVVAMAASEAKTRPDPRQFIKDLRYSAIEAANRFGHQETVVSAESYSDELIEAIVKASGVDLSEDSALAK